MHINQLLHRNFCIVSTFRCRHRHRVHSLYVYVIYATQLSYTKRRVDFPPVSQFDFILSPFFFGGTILFWTFGIYFGTLCALLLLASNRHCFTFALKMCVCVWIPFFYSSVFLGCFGPCCVLNNEFPGEMLSFCLLSLSLPSYILNVYTMVITDVPYCQCEMCIIQSRKLCVCMLEPFLLIEMQRPALVFSTSFIHSVCCWWWWCSCRVAWLNILPSLIQQIQQWLWLT